MWRLRYTDSVYVFCASHWEDGFFASKILRDSLGIVELCAKILQIMRNDFKDYARTFANYAQLFQFKFQSIKNGNRNTLSTRKQ